MSVGGRETQDGVADPSGRITATAASHWTLVTSYTALVVVAVLLAAGGLLLARADIALLSLPLLIAAGWCWDKRPPAGAASAIELDIDAEPSDAELGYRVRVQVPHGVESVALRLATLEGGHSEIVVTADTARELTGRVPVLHSGPQEIVRAEYRMFGADALFASDPHGPTIAHRVLPPPFAPISDLPIPRRLLGLTGNHESSSPGDGGEFRDIHPFTSGDRLRRIDWKTTARRGRFAGDLYVRRTSATADTTIMIVLDSRDDVGEQITEWGRNSTTEKGIGSLDLARESASSIAAGYARAGDRVGFQDLANQTRLIDNGGGSRHLDRLLRAIELTQPSGGARSRLRAPVVAPGALIYVLSTFLDAEAAKLAALWRGGGHRVIAVDVLPAPRFARSTRIERIAHRIVIMERNDRIRVLEAQGVEFVRWQDDGTTEPRHSRFRMLSRPVRGSR